MAIPADNKNVSNCTNVHQYESSYERRVETYLKSKNIKYLREHKFPGCTYTAQLYVDFYLPEYNVVIEIDGQHHFKDKIKYRRPSVSGGISITDLKLVNSRDASKNEYMLEKKIHLLRISHTIFEHHTTSKKISVTDIINKFLLFTQIPKNIISIMWFVGDDYCMSDSLKKLELTVAFIDQSSQDLLEMSHHNRNHLILVDSSLYE